MTDQMDRSGSSKPNSASDDALERLPYASIGGNFPGQIDIKKDHRRGSLIVKILRPIAIGLELSPEVGDGSNREGGISWGCLTTSLLH